jgi:hypothetical protein
MESVLLSDILAVLSLIMMDVAIEDESTNGRSELGVRKLKETRENLN